MERTQSSNTLSLVEELSPEEKEAKEKARKQAEGQAKAAKEYEEYVVLIYNPGDEYSCFVV